MQRADALRLSAEPVEIAIAPVARDAAAEEAVILKAIDAGRAVFLSDGGDVAFVEFDGAVVWVRLSGACADCAAAPLTLLGVQKDICARLGRKVRVLPVDKGIRR